ncbi:hypothetical protein [Staphylococcus argenteus]|uniref:hypothetical protein n=1 Tax=Staphylococcus argenteus TaxID=985002 RepID=UPI0015C598EE|nr:hypothetical protein [Staphylococcus argenteus]
MTCLIDGKLLGSFSIIFNKSTRGIQLFAFATTAYKVILFVLRMSMTYLIDKKLLGSSSSN